MLKAKINENGVFELNRGGMMKEMKCPFHEGGTGCGFHCPFFGGGMGFWTITKDKGSYAHSITLTCMDKEKEFLFREDELIDERKKK